MNPPTPLALRIITHNIRTTPLLRHPHEKPWTTRKHHIINQLSAQTDPCPECLICLQEVLHQQLTDILTGLNTNVARANSANPTSQKLYKQEDAGWKHIGTGRDAATKGEHTPILYNASTWTAEWSETRWLTDPSHPSDKPSRGWDAAHRRIVTAAALRHRASGRRVLAMNTHLDHRGRVSRVEGARRIGRWVGEWLGSCRTGGSRVEGVFLCGDFNTASRGDDDAYGALTGSGGIFEDCKMLLGKGQGGREQEGLNACTFTGFNENAKDDALIDYVLLGSGGEQRAWSVRSYDVLPNRADDGIYLSDHRAVVVDVELAAVCSH